MQMNLHHLRVFKTVVEQGSFSRAAAALYMSQPAVSLQVKALEQSVGITLFDRTGRGLQLTAAGREVLAYGERIIGLVDEVGLVLEELRGAKRGEVNVAASTTAGIYVVPSLLGAFHRQNPGVKLTLDVENRYRVQELLLNNEADLAIMGLIENEDDLEVAQFLTNDLVVTASPGHPLAKRRGINLRDIGNELLLLREGGSGTRTDVERIFSANGIPLRLGMELRSSGAIKQAVAAELGITIMPRSALDLELLTGRLVILDVIGFPVRRHWSLARRAGRHLSAAAVALWDFLLAYRDQVRGAG